MWLTCRRTLQPYLPSKPLAGPQSPLVLFPSENEPYHSVVGTLLLHKKYCQCDKDDPPQIVSHKDPGCF